MNRIEAFTALMNGQKVQLVEWAGAGWYLELGGLPSFQGGVPDQIMFVNGETKLPHTHWPDSLYQLYEMKKEVTAAVVGNALTVEATKLGLPQDKVSSLVSGVNSALGF